MYSKKVVKLSGLVEAGKNEEGEQQYIGTDKQWQKAEELQEIEDELIDNKIDDILEGN